MPYRRRLQCIVLLYIALTRTPDVAWLLIHSWLFQPLGAVLLGAVLGRPLRPAVQGRGWKMLPLALMLVGAAWLIDDSLMWAALDLTVTTLILVAAWPDGPRRRRRAVLPDQHVRRRWSVEIPVLRAAPVFSETVGSSAA